VSADIELHGRIDSMGVRSCLQADAEYGCRTKLILAGDHLIGLRCFCARFTGQLWFQSQTAGSGSHPPCQV